MNGIKADKSKKTSVVILFIRVHLWLKTTRLSLADERADLFERDMKPRRVIIGKSG